MASSQQEEHDGKHPTLGPNTTQQQQQQQLRAGGGGSSSSSMLTRAFHSLQPRRKHGGPGNGPAHSITSPKFFDDNDAHTDAGALHRKASSVSQKPHQSQPDKELQAFTGVFPHPAPGCSPTEPPPQHAKLTPDQNKKYEAMLAHFSQPNLTFPVTFQAGAQKRELNDWETCRLLTRESMLRYLRATKWDLNAAKRRLTDTIIWRREYGVDDLDPDYVEAEARSGKETVLGFDKRGRPLHYMTPHLNDTPESPRQMKFAVWILERCIDLMPPGVEQLALLINFQHKSRNPTSIANAKLMLYILQNHYVERLGIALCINVPWIFKTFFAAIQPFIDPVTREKCKFDEAIKQEVPLDQLNSDYGGNVDPTYVHDKYWPDLVRTCDRIREKQLERFRTLCDGKVGASEWVIRGGDPDKAPGTNLVPVSTNGTAREASVGKQDEVTTVEEADDVKPVEAAKEAQESQQTGPDAPSTDTAAMEPASSTESSSVKKAADQAAATATAVLSSAAGSAKGIANSTAEVTSSAASAALPLLGSLVGIAQAAAQTAVQTAGRGASVAEAAVARLAGGVATGPAPALSTSSSEVTADPIAQALGARSAPSQTQPLHSEDLALAPPTDISRPRTPAAVATGVTAKDKLQDLTLPSRSATPAPAMQGEHGSESARLAEEGASASTPAARVTVLYFAAARSAAGVPSVQIGLPRSLSSSHSSSMSSTYSTDVNNASTKTSTTTISLATLPALLVQDARQRAADADKHKDGQLSSNSAGAYEIDPDELERVLLSSQLSVDQEMVDQDEWDRVQLGGGEEVGVIPPVSGG